MIEAGMEMFKRSQNEEYQVNPLTATFLIVAWIVLIIWVGKYLWNNVLSRVVTVVKPMDNLWQMFGLMILIGILFPRKMN